MAMTRSFILVDRPPNGPPTRLSRDQGMSPRPRSSSAPLPL
jgi:hypothetical protein